MPGDYIPAGGRVAFLTPLYDRTMALTMREEVFRPRLLAQTVAGHPARVLEVGCGTGSFTVRVAAALPEAEVIGLDPDAEVLARARTKDRTGRVEWIEGFASPLPFADESFDRVVASLVLHHLDDDAKHQALREARRVLRPGGRLHIADWGRPSGLLIWCTFTLLRALDGFEATRAHAAGELAQAVERAGFARVTRRNRLRTGWGTLELLEAGPS